jgi:hypothetical protein
LTNADLETIISPGQFSMEIPGQISAEIDTRAYEGYRRAFSADLNHYWAGLGALQMCAAAKSLAEEHLRPCRSSALYAAANL